jgi:hypothetical protein
MLLAPVGLCMAPASCHAAGPGEIVYGNFRFVYGSDELSRAITVLIPEGNFLYHSHRWFRRAYCFV